MLKDLWKVLTGELSSSKMRWQENNLGMIIDEQRKMIAVQNQAISKRIDPLLLGVGRLIAKIEPMYGKDPDDPKRKAESDKLGKEVIKRLEAEAAVQRRQREVGV